MVNVFTEWGVLKEAVVGSCLNWSADLSDPTFEMVHYDNLKTQKYRKTSKYQLDKFRYEERTRDLDNFAEVLQNCGVKVHRPLPLKKPTVIKTPWWNGICTAPDNPRDVAICLGDTIVETPPTIRGRYFESMHYRDIFLSLFKQGANWVKAPNPTLEEYTIDPDKNWKRYTETYGLENIEPQFQISFDAANIIKFGKDIIFNIGSKNHELGYYWFKRIFPEFNIHPVRLCDSHIDAIIAPLCPGVLLYNPQSDKKRSVIPQLPKALQKWKILAMEDESTDCCKSSEEVFLASDEGMHINCLSIGDKSIIIQNTAVKTICMLDKEGFNPIPVPFSQGRLFSGGIHCCSLDLVRDEGMETYF